MKKGTIPPQEEDIERSWHPNFAEYTKMIVNHPNYKGLLKEWNEETKRYVWMRPKKSPQGKIRDAWWHEQMALHGISENSASPYAKISRILHPTKIHVCQCCGKGLSIFCKYPTKPMIGKLQDILPSFQALGEVQPADYSIDYIIDHFCDDALQLDSLAMLFGFEAGHTPEEIKDLIFKYYAEDGKKKLSPGVMSNCPDRFDGFHSDGLCCRSKTDKGRHKSNMQTYTQDRRAYEEWADGNYRFADRLMGEFKKDTNLYICPKCRKPKRMTPDHIGPISLGFCHSGLFAPLCNSCNSSKNNRFSKRDVDILLSYEKEGIPVISWHAKPIWDILKNRITDDNTAFLASVLMGEHHQNVLFALAIIYKLGGEPFLRTYLHPEYSLKEYKFSNFDPLHLDKLVVEEYDVDSENTRKLQHSYARRAFRHLEEFYAKTNRRHQFYFSEEDEDLIAVANDAREGRFKMANKRLRMVFKRLARTIVKQKWSK